LWRADLQAEAEQLLRAAQKLKQVGRFQIEAAIQSAHAVRAHTGAADWPAIVALYDALAALTGSDVARLNRAAALAQIAGPQAALQAVVALEPALEAYQPLWALKAHLLAARGRQPEARTAFDRAIALTNDAALIAYLTAERAACI
jgi:RNA polymerase sigma-70 factor, ECF subfamily